jgi:hypothetical protein
VTWEQDDPRRCGRHRAGVGLRWAEVAIAPRWLELEHCLLQKMSPAENVKPSSDCESCSYMKSAMYQLTAITPGQSSHEALS